jgi:HSP20 family protein
MTSCYVYPRPGFGSLQREIDRMFGQTPKETRPAAGTRIGEDANHYYIEMDAPGLKSDSLDITVKNRELTVHAEYGPVEPEGAEIQWRQGAPRTGNFDHRFRLPESIDAEKIQAAYNQGVLQVTVPKSEGTKPRQIAVEVR